MTPWPYYGTVSGRDLTARQQHRCDTKWLAAPKKVIVMTLATNSIGEYYKLELGGVIEVPFG